MVRGSQADGGKNAREAATVAKSACDWREEVINERGKDIAKDVDESGD